MSNHLFQQARSLSSGTVSYLIDCTLYDVVYVVRREFALWCLRNPHYDNWVQAWTAFSKGWKP
jgi:hypothetical protein